MGLLVTTHNTVMPSISCRPPLLDDVDVAKSFISY